MNVACALARLGTPSAFIGRLGTDPIGLSFEVLLASRGVSISGLQHDVVRSSRIVLVKEIPMVNGCSKDLWVIPVTGLPIRHWTSRKCRFHGQHYLSMLSGLWLERFQWQPSLLLRVCIG